MANVFKGVLSFEIKGEPAIRKLNAEFDRLGVKIDMAYKKIRIGKKEVQTASATLHGLNRQQMKDMEDLIRKSSEYYTKMRPKKERSLYEATTTKPGSLEGAKIGQLEKDPSGQLFDPEQRKRQQESKDKADEKQAESDRKRREREYNKAKKDAEKNAKDVLKEVKKGLADIEKAHKECADTRKFIAETVRDFEIDSIKQANNAEIESLKQLESALTEKYQKELDLHKRAKKILAEERKERVANLRIAKRHLYELEQMGNRVGGVFNNFPVLKVFAFDMLRRTFTSMYQTVNAIGNKIGQWFVDSIKFNDEIRRSETFFTSLGLLGLKGAQGGQLTLAEAKGSKDPELKKVFEKSAANSRKLMIDMMAISAETGQDLQEVVGSTRQATTDLLNKMVKEGQKNPYLETPEVFNDVANRMVRLASVLRMSDPGNRKLSFHMVGLQELFSGTTEGKKDSGLANVLSLMRREGIKVGKAYATEISKLVNAGKLKEAMDVVEMVLTRSGLGLEQIGNFMSETLQPAIDGTIMFLKVFGAIFTSEVYDTFRFFFQEVVKTFSELKKNEAFNEMLKRTGILLEEALLPSLLKVGDIIEYIEQNPTGMEENITDAIEIFKQGLEITTNLIKAFGLFMMGFLGGGESEGLDSFVKGTEYLVKNARKAGESFRWFADQIMKYADVIIMFAIFGKIVGVIAGMVAFWAAITGYLTAMAAAGAKWAPTLLRVAGIMARLNLAGILITLAMVMWEFRDQIIKTTKKTFNLLKEIIVNALSAIPGLGRIIEIIKAGKAIHQERIAEEDRKYAERKEKEERDRQEAERKNALPNQNVQTVKTSNIPQPVVPSKPSPKGGAQISINTLTVQANNPEEFKQQMAKTAVANGVEPSFFTSIGAVGMG